MKFRTLGKTGISISEIGFGAWALGGAMWAGQNDDDSLQALQHAISKGVNFIDTAAGYGNGHSEKVIGKFLSGQKEKIWVATKIPPAAGSWPPSPYDKIEDCYPEKYIREMVEERLRYLNVDCIDILQLHTWTRAWNKNPKALDTLRKIQAEGKIKHIGISTPEQDQNSLIELMRKGYLDVVQVIYNLFEQEPAAEFLPAALEAKVGVIVRVAFDEGSLTGKFTVDSKFAEGDFRADYFHGDRFPRTVRRVELIKKDLVGSGYTMPQAALKFVLAHPAVGVVIPGIRNIAQAEANTSVSDMTPMPQSLLEKLHAHNWLRGNWYPGNL